MVAPRILSFDTKIIREYSGGMIKIGILVKIFDPAKKSLEVCVDFLDADDFATSQFCRTTKYSPEKFTQRGDTTVFRCVRTLEDAKSCIAAEVSVREIKAPRER